MVQTYIMTPYVQNYDWGKLGSSSLVGRLSGSPESATPYAELWMGDHPSGPCVIRKQESDDPLPVSTITHSSLPYLFKILSVRKALSIQSHPDAVLARQLHALCPSVYKDPNPKPEMAIALTPFRALLGFRPVDDVMEIFKVFPVLESIVGRSSHPESEWLKSAYSSLMRLPSPTVQEVINSILSFPAPPDHLESTVSLMRQLNAQFPNGDVGVLSVLFMNIIDLAPGECIFIGPNVLHAYIAGDLIECMANSDNVIRGGLTPKFKDVDTLLKSLDFVPGRGTRVTPDDSGVYAPPDVPFAVRKVNVSSGGSVSVPVTCGVSVVLILEGQGSVGVRRVEFGSVVLLENPEGETTVDVCAESMDLVAYMAYSIS
jgi:mannose-6-phosphate isomerase